MTVFDYTLPVSGIAMQWKPLKVGTEMDIRAAYKSEAQKHLLHYMLLAARISRYGEKDRCDLSDVREWDALDLEAFTDEVTLREEERRAAFAAKRSNGSPIQDLEAAYAQASVALNGLNIALGAVMSCAKAAQPGPLES